jgi:small subunit ribosomal protein S6
VKLYETGLIFDPTLEEAGFDEQIKKVTDIIESNSGKIENIDRWGIRKLAYLIKKKSQGFYTFIYYNSPPEVPQLLEKMLRINENCLRFMTIVPDYLPECLEEKVDAPAVTRDVKPEPAPEPIPEPELKDVEENTEEPKEDV